MAQQLFVPTGSMETFVVPRHQPGTLRVTVAGAQGGAAGASPLYHGGQGGTVRGYLDLAAGTTLHVIAGEPGEGGTQVGSQTGLGGGPALGGQGGDGGAFSSGIDIGGGGGAASEVRTSTNIADRLIVAGGGGGGGRKSALQGQEFAGQGGLGIADGLPQPLPPAGASTGGSGQGGTLSGPGAGGLRATNLPATHGDDGAPGSGGAGGAGAAVRGAGFPANGGGGGGGGGYYGGGGGGSSYLSSLSGGGGGGSSWANTAIVTGIDHIGGNTGAGYVLFEWEPRRHGRHLGLVRGSRGVG